MSSVAIVVLNWNGLDDTRKCIESLHSQSYNNFTILLVENGSTEPGTKEMMAELQDRHSRLHVLYNRQNLGFAGGVNVGIRYAIENNFEFVALFNNDAVADRKWLEELVSAQKVQKSGITTGLLLHEDGNTIDSTGDWCSTWGLPFPRDRNKPTKEASPSGFVFSGSGGASLYSVKMLEEIGLFDEHFFAYYEDTDVSFRAQLYGWKVYYTKKAIAYHKQGATSDKIAGFTVRQTFKNLPLFFYKNTPTALLFSVGSRFWLAYCLMFGNAIKNGAGLAAFQGYMQHLVIFWKSSFWQRFTIQLNKKVSAKYIQDILWSDLPPDQTGLRKFRSWFTGNR